MSDVVRVMHYILSQPIEVFINRLFNIGQGHSISIRDLSDLILLKARKILGKEPKIIIAKNKVNQEDQAFFYDCKKILDTGFIFSGDLELELEELLVFCREHFFASKN